MDNDREMINETKQRVKSIDKDTETLESFYSKSDSTLTSNITEIETRVSMLEKNSQEITELIDQLNKFLPELVSKLKNSASKEDIERLNKMLLEFNPEFWITREQAIEEIKNVIEDKKIV